MSDQGRDELGNFVSVKTACARRLGGACGHMKIAILSATALSATLAVPALAQSAENASASNEIIVTAQRRQERLEDVPMSVAALAPETLEKANVTNIHELGRIAPGVQVNFGGVSTQPSIRGVTSLTNGFGNENNVAIYVDGFYVPDNQSINGDLANLESIQVLKGPQGTLYGRNATGGAILFNTLDPSDTVSAKLNLSAARFDEVRATAYVSMPITEGVGIMVAGALRSSDGHIRFSDPNNNMRASGDAAKQRQRSVRVKLKADVSEDLSVTLAYNHAYSSDPSGVLFTTFEHAPPAGNARAGRFGLASYNHDTEASASTDEATAKIALDTGIGTLTSYTGMAWRSAVTSFDFDGTYNDILFSTSTNKQKVFQQAIDYSIDVIDNLDLVVGGLYLHDKYHQVAGQVAFGPGLVPQSRTFRPLKTEAWAVYADATFKVTDRFTIGVGGRYSRDHRFVSQYTTDGNFNVTAPQYNLDQTFSAFTPRATLRYELAERTNIYASFSKGFRAGAYNSAPVASEALSVAIKPEKINAYEVGFKTAQSNLRFEIAGYYYDYTNLHVSLTVPDPRCQGQVGCGVVTVTGNAPKAEIYGIDTQLTLTPVENFNITLGGAWIHARYGTFPNAIGTGLDIRTDRNLSGQVQNWTGQEMARAPEFSGSINADYTVPLAEGELTLTGTVNYTDSYVISNPSLYGPAAGAALANKQRFRQDSYVLVNAGIDWKDPSGRLTLGVFGKNLTNKSYRLTYNGGAFGDYSAKAAPVSYGVRLGFQY